MKTHAVIPSILAFFMLAGAGAAAAEAGPGRWERLDAAYASVREKRWAQAIERLGALLDETPGDARLRLQLGYARLELGDRAAAADEFALAAREPGELQEQARQALKSLEEEPPEAAGIRRDALLNAGYADLRREDGGAAREKFEQALLADPGRTMIAKQLGYMSAAEGNAAEAAARLEGVRRLDPGDHLTALELGYLYDSLHEEAAAERSFAAATAASDPRIRAAAQKALDGIRSRTDPLYLDLEAAALSSSRFANNIFLLDAMAGWKPVPDGPLALYGAVRGTRDTRSRAGEVPEIYSDGAASIAPGLRLQPKGWNTSLSAEWGLTVNLMRTEERPDRTQTDGRVVLSDYRYWPGPRRLFADSSLSAGWYGRYRDNVIGSLRVRGGLRLRAGPRSQVTLYAPVYLLKDTNRDFYNNLAEAGAGIEFQPLTTLNLSVRAEYLRGWYAGIEGRDRNPYGPRYEEIRATVAYYAHFSRRPDATRFEPTRRRRPVW